MAVLLPAATARADGVIYLGAAAPEAIAVDGVHEQVYLAFPDLSSVQVRSYAGALIATVSGQTGAFDLTLSPDQSRLFVLLSDGHITAIDTTTLAEVGRWSLPADTCGQDIAWAGVSLFVAWNHCQNDGSALSSLDTTDPTAELSTYFSSRIYASSIEGGGNTLVSYQYFEGNPDTQVTFDASTLPPTELASAPDGRYCGDAAVTADGSEVTLACRSAIVTRRTSDLAVTESYPGSYANKVAASVAEASGVLAFQGWPSGNGTEVDVFRRGEPSPARTVTWATDEHVWRDALAFTPDASRLFAVTRIGEEVDPHTYLRIVTAPTLTPFPTSLSVTSDKSTYAYGGTALVTAHLGVTHDSRRVNIFATPYKGTRQLIKTGDVNASGNLAVHYSVSRATTFTAEFLGDFRYTATSVTRQVRARAKMLQTLYNAYGSKGKYVLFRPKKDPVIGVVVVPTQRATCSRFKLQHRINGAWHKVATNPCSPIGKDSTAYGRLAGPHVEGSRFRVRAVTRASAYSAHTKGTWAYIKFQHR
jgi:hypothetical protein